ncbi:MAG: putative epimerase [Idiomarinaceae bacterium HL-53]|nr:MAG: putative epimerase [Idiomarinaceae bacterium HL-53]CUS48863.1 phenazine biosynthesis protein PhzF family [Idiomarinaceae bacterium HL-53]
MLRVPIYQVDAFADELFSGNPAAVCPLPYWFPDGVLKKIAAENNLSETAFIVNHEKGLEIRWFTPEAEVDLCGHATLGSAHVLFTHLGYSESELEFQSRSGPLRVVREEQMYAMDFPAQTLERCKAPEPLLLGLGISPQQVYKGFDYVVEYASATEVLAIEPNLEALMHIDGRGVVVTAPADSHEDYQFISRAFFPKLKVPEDPVTGSAHCELAPFWASKLGRNQVIGYQASARGGRVVCELNGERVAIKGAVVDYLRGEITLPKKLLRGSESV